MLYYNISMVVFKGTNKSLGFLKILQVDTRDDAFVIISFRNLSEEDSMARS